MNDFGQTSKPLVYVTSPDQFSVPVTDKALGSNQFFLLTLKYWHCGEELSKRPQNRNVPQNASQLQSKREEKRPGWQWNYMEGSFTSLAPSTSLLDPVHIPFTWKFHLFLHICSEKRNILRQLVQVDRGEEVSDALPVSHAHNAALLIVREGHRGTESNKTALRGGLGGGESGGLCRLRLKLGEIINSTTAVSVFWNDTGVWMRRHRWGRKWSNHPKISKQSWSWAQYCSRLLWQQRGYGDTSFPRPLWHQSDRMLKHKTHLWKTERRPRRANRAWSRCHLNDFHCPRQQLNNLWLRWGGAHRSTWTHQWVPECCWGGSAGSEHWESRHVDFD